MGRVFYPAVALLLSSGWYLGLALVLVGGLCVLRPMGWLRLPTRRRAAPE